MVIFFLLDLACATLVNVRIHIDLCNFLPLQTFYSNLMEKQAFKLVFADCLRIFADLFATFCRIVAEFCRFLWNFADLLRNFADFCVFFAEFYGICRGRKSQR